MHNILSTIGVRYVASRQLIIFSIYYIGLSSFDENPTKAFEYIKPLLQFAADWIPNEHHSETPLYILATAGMRLIDYEKQQAILSNVRVGIATHFDFSFPERYNTYICSIISVTMMN